MWDSPTIQDELMKQKLISQGKTPEEIEQIMVQVKQAEGLKAKSSMTDPIAPMDTLTAQDNPAYPIAGPVGPPAPAQVSDQAAGAVSPSSPAPAAPVAPAAGESFYDRMGPEGLEGLLGMKGMDRQLEHAQALRDKEGPKGMHTRSMYVAANPLSHIASAVEKYRAKKDIKRLGEDEKGYIKQIASYLRDKPEAVEEDPEVGLGLGRVH